MNTDDTVGFESIADLFLGNDQEVVISRIGTEKLSASNVFTENSAPTQVVQASTVVEVNYSKGYAVTIGLTGSFVPNLKVMQEKLCNNSPDIFRDIPTLILAIETADFHFEPQGTFLSFEKSDAFSGSDGQFKKLDSAYDRLWSDDGYDTFMNESLEFISKSINDKTFSLADEIINKAKQSAIDLLKNNNL